MYSDLQIPPPPFQGHLEERDAEHIRDKTELKCRMWEMSMALMDAMRHGQGLPPVVKARAKDAMSLVFEMESFK